MTLATREGGICIIVLVQRNKITGRMLSTVVSVQQQLMTQRLLNSHKQKMNFGVVLV